MSNQKLNLEINSFQEIWEGGYRTGYNPKRNQKGIEEYLRHNLKGKTLLEIGCGGGQWSKFIYELNIFEKIYCIDVLSEEHNKFWNYVGNDKKDKITYIQVNNFNLDFLSNKEIDYVFSYDVFCHISLTGQNEYLKNLYNKCNTNCTLFIMYSDVDKYFSSEPENIKFWEIEQNQLGRRFQNIEEFKLFLKNDCDSDPLPGRWYWVGREKFINNCKLNNYKIISEDLNIDKTNPITLFTI